ncbi:TRAP transporter small permease [Cobetia sp. L2A1]|uniref:TRAP transporter small permease n=1 Tax=Cobetia sp. L2A1 TaxID=2686360 RepID=UPI00131D8963|nr:TRAP transporter small permease [Cobetia sp. L2A1]
MSQVSQDSVGGTQRQPPDVPPIVEPAKARPESWLAALALGGIGLISLANVVVRYATNASFAFTEEFSVFLLVLLTLAGASVAIRHQAHIRIAMLEDYLPLPVWRVVVVLQTLACLLVLGMIVWFGGRFALEEYQWDSLSPGLGLPNWWYVIWLPVLAVAMAWRQWQQCVERLRRGPEQDADQGPVDQVAKQGNNAASTPDKGRDHES